MGWWGGAGWRTLHSSVAIRAEGDRIADLIRTAIGKLPNVVDFQIRGAAGIGEGGWRVAAFAYAVCSAE